MAFPLGFFFPPLLSSPIENVIGGNDVLKMWKGGGEGGRGGSRLFSHGILESKMLVSKPFLKRTQWHSASIWFRSRSPFFGFLTCEIWQNPTLPEGGEK